MLKLRMSRGGSKKRPFYRLVIAEHTSPRDGKYIERVGSFNPLLPKDHKERLVLQTERIKYWLGQGAQPSERVARFLGEASIIPMPARRNNPEKAIPKAKAQARIKEREDKAAKAIEDKVKAEEEAKVAAAAPAPAPVEEAAPAPEAESEAQADAGEPAAAEEQSA